MVEPPPSPESLKARRYFNVNRVKVPREELLPYAGKCVAWAPDGTRVVDADDSSGLALFNRLKERTGRPWDFVYEVLLPADALGSPEDRPVVLRGDNPRPPPEQDPWRGVQYSTWNRSNFPSDILTPYAGKWVAWSVDGTWVVDVDTVSLFVTDYQEYYYLPAPLVGFWPPAPVRRRSVLGATGFLQHFDVRLLNRLSRPEVELVDVPTFPGTHGALSKSGPLEDFLRGLRLNP
jgi:hypothetical protein